MRVGTCVILSRWIYDLGHISMITVYEGIYVIISRWIYVQKCRTFEVGPHILTHALCVNVPNFFFNYVWT